MKLIYKYELNFEYSYIVIPKGATIVKAGGQNDAIYIWCMFDESNNSIQEGRTFRIFGTGEQIPEHLTYIDTVFERRYVWHIFEEVATRT